MVRPMNQPASAAGSAIELLDLRKAFGDVRAVDGVDVAVAPGSFLVLLGPSGCGKTTILRMLAGLESPTGGQITMNGTVVADGLRGTVVAAGRRNAGLVFQSYALWPHMTVAGNCEFPLKLRKIPAAERRTRVQEALDLVEMGAFAKRYPHELSGGQQQRVAIARALINEPTLILADEPTANLDSRAGHETMQLLRRIAKERGRTVVIVSHDERIKDIADRVLWLEDGQFKDIVHMVTDPVCGMTIERAPAVSLEYEGTTYYFCSRGCSWEFQESPERFVTKAARVEGVG